MEEVAQPDDGGGGGEDSEGVLDVSPTGCSIREGEDPKQVFIYDNVFTILPSTIGRFRNLKVLKFFSNDVRYLASDLDDLPQLEELQLRATSPGLNGLLPLGKMRELKALELHQVPPRPSAATLPADISLLHGLQRLSICHFSVSFLPPEIGTLQKLEEVDFSFNKLKLLPKEIAQLGSLKSLVVSSNKLVELPDLSTMSTLTRLDVGYNKLTSLRQLDLPAMTSLRELNVQFNKLQETGEIPEWISCNLEGNNLSGDAKVETPHGGIHLTERRIILVRDAAQRKGTYISGKKHKLEELQSNSEKLGRSANDDAERDAGKETHVNGNAICMDDELKTEADVGDENKGLALQTDGNSDAKQDENKAAELAHKKMSRGRASNDEEFSKPNKRRKSANRCSEVSFKYRRESYCGFKDHMLDGFYDAGRDRPFTTLEALEAEKIQCGAREVILVDRERDEELDCIVSRAKQFLTRTGKTSDVLDRIEMLALFVSDCFGGSDKTLNVRNMRRSTLGWTTAAPFVCSCCSTTVSESSLPSMRALSDEAIRDVKLRRGSNVVLLGSLPYGVCRHRAILFKYLCDRANPVIPCELVRGFLDYTPHAWNVVLDANNVRMVVDACRPLDIRPESEPEYFCRYIPLRRIHLQGPLEVELGSDALLPIFYEEIGAGSSGAVVRKCRLGDEIVAAKIRHLDAVKSYESSVKSTEGAWLSELRMHCSVGKHPCVVGFYGHQLSFDTVVVNSSSKRLEAPQLVIFMEYVEGGSLEKLIGDLAGDGHTYMPPARALQIAKSVASGLAWLHSRGIIHRDVKSSNVLVSCGSESFENDPSAKICDFDSSVPLGSSSLHTCYLAHHGLPLTDVCVGTPRWMAPEVLNSIYSRQKYGLEADIWSFGCLVLELLTLQVPYTGVDVSELHTYIKSGQRPQLTWQLEELDAPAADKAALKLLVEVYEMCTEDEPAKRPTASKALEKLSADRVE